MQRFYRLALPLFVLLNVLDVLTSWVDFSLGAQEGNPLIAALLTDLGFGGLILFKIGLVLAVSVGVLTLERLKARRVARFVLSVGVLMGLLWVFFNVIGAILH